jgi:hypothetical protein
MARLTNEVFDEEWLRDFMGQVKNLEKGVLVDHKCPHCEKRGKVTIPIPDFKAILDSVVEFFNQSYGRPATADGEPGGVTIIVERRWPVGTADQVNV